jgi:putative transposase
LRLAQVVGKAASANVRSIKSKVDKANEAEKKKKYQLEILNSYNNHEIKLTLRDLNLELDKRFILIEENKGNKKGKASKIDGKTVDYWIKVISFPNNSFFIPLFLTNHMKSLIKRGYSMELDHARINSNGTIGIFFSKEIKPYNEKVNPIKAVGIDLGRDTLVACSDNSRETTHKTGKPVKEIIFNISRKKSGSNNQKRAIKFLRNQVNYSVKHDINWARIDDIFIENLKDMKRHKKWGRQSHFWPVSYVRKQIKNISRENDVRLTEVYAAGTSQECNVCGFQHKKNRIDERFECLNCREKADANNQASVNIFFRGANSPSYKKRVRNNKIYEPISVDLLPEVKSATGISVIFRAFDEGGVSYTDLRKCMK